MTAGGALMARNAVAATPTQRRHGKHVTPLDRQRRRAFERGATSLSPKLTCMMTFDRI